MTQGYSATCTSIAAVTRSQAIAAVTAVTTCTAWAAISAGACFRPIAAAVISITAISPCASCATRTPASAPRITPSAAVAAVCVEGATKV